MEQRRHGNARMRWLHVPDREGIRVVGASGEVSHRQEKCLIVSIRWDQTSTDNEWLECEDGHGRGPSQLIGNGDRESKKLDDPWLAGGDWTGLVGYHREAT